MVHTDLPSTLSTLASPLPRQTSVVLLEYESHERSGPVSPVCRRMNWRR